MNCFTCSTSNLEDANFCRNCGDPLGGYATGDSNRSRRVSFQDAVKLGFQRCFEFHGRSTRAEFWWWFLFQYGAIFTAAVIDALAGTSPVLYLITGLGLTIPYLAVYVRRLHDTNKTGWWILIGFVPFGFIALFVMLLQASDVEINKYGPRT